MASLKISRTMHQAEPRIKAILQSYGPDGMSILTKAQMDRSMKMIQQRQKKKEQSLSSSQPKKDCSKQKPQQRTAAVLIPICTVNSIPSILFTLRSPNVKTHKSEISFPGGHSNYHDDFGVESPEQTALRETQEELAGDNHNNKRLYDYQNGIEILGTLQSVPSLTGIPVTPVIGSLRYDLKAENPMDLHHVFPGDRGEVEHVFAMSVEDLIKVETAEPLPRLGKGVLGPVYPVVEKKMSVGYDEQEQQEEEILIGKIWGLTAIILRPVLKNVLRPVFLSGASSAKTAEARNSAL